MGKNGSSDLTESFPDHKKDSTASSNTNLNGLGQLKHNRQGENCVSEVAFHKMGEVVFGTVMKLRALISLNMEGYTPISSKSGHMPFLWRFSS